jgi:hypothetical protein
MRAYVCVCVCVRVCVCAFVRVCVPTSGSSGSVRIINTTNSSIVNLKYLRHLKGKKTKIYLPPFTGKVCVYSYVIFVWTVRLDWKLNGVSA